MKKLIFSLFLLTSLFFSACKDKCKDVLCLNGGACDEGICKCPTGFSGPNCEVAPVPIDLCANVICQNGGTCINGVCDCPPGYSGTNCQTPDNSKFVGSWKYNETCDGLVISDYSVQITAVSGTVNKIKIIGFAGFNCDGPNVEVEATVSANNITVSPNQNACDQQVVIVSGSGTINTSANSITITYTYQVAGTSGTCTGTYTKQ
jgi:hypothetical protein